MYTSPLVQTGAELELPWPQLVQAVTEHGRRSSSRPPPGSSHRGRSSYRPSPSQAAAARPGRRRARASVAAAACLTLLAPPSWLELHARPSLFELAPPRGGPWKNTIQTSNIQTKNTSSILHRFKRDLSHRCTVTKTNRSRIKIVKQ